MIRLPLARKVRTLLVASIAFTLASLWSASAQLDLSLLSTNYLQDFTSIGSGIPQGWSLHTAATVSSLGNSSNLNTTATSWGTATGQFGNYASTVSNAGTNFLGTESSSIQSACTNRALAVRQTGSGGFDPGAAFVLQLLNTTNRFHFSLNLDCVTLNVKERAATWTIDYSIGGPTNFVPVASVEDPRVFGATNVSVSFGTALDDQTNSVWIRVAALSVTTPGSGSRNIFGIDNFSLAWEGPAEVPAILPVSLDISAIDGAAVLTWTNSIYDLQASGNLLDGFTNVPNATSPYTNSLQADQMFFRLVHTNAP